MRAFSLSLGSLRAAQFFIQFFFYIFHFNLFVVQSSWSGRAHCKIIGWFIKMKTRKYEIDEKEWSAINEILIRSQYTIRRSISRRGVAPANTKSCSSNNKSKLLCAECKIINSRQDSAAGDDSIRCSARLPSLIPSKYIGFQMQRLAFRAEASYRCHKVKWQKNQSQLSLLIMQIFYWSAQSWQINYAAIFDSRVHLHSHLLAGFYQFPFSELSNIYEKHFAAAARR